MSWSRRSLLASLALAPACARTPAFPSTSDQFSLRLPKLTKIEIGGAELYFAPDPGVPLVAMTVALRAGHGLERPAEVGATALLEWVLREHVDELADQQGALASVWVDRELLAIRARTERPRAGALLRSLIDRLRVPSCTPAQLERALHASRLTLDLVAGEHEDLAGLALVHGMLAARPASEALGLGSRTSLVAAARERAASWWAEHARLDRLVVVLAGALDEREADAWFEAALASWPTPRGPGRGLLDVAAEPGRPTRVAFERAHATGLVALARMRGPFGAASELERVVEEFTWSDVDARLRARLRLSYGASPLERATRHGTLDQVSWVVAPDEVGSAAAELSEVLAMQREPWRPSTSASERVRRAAMTRFMAGFQGLDALRTRLERLAVHRAALDVYERQLDTLRRLDAEQLALAARASARAPRGLALLGDTAALLAAEREIGDVERVALDALTGQPASAP